MTAFYQLHRNPQRSKDEFFTAYHPRFVNKTTSRMEKVLELASSFSSFSSADIIGVLEVLKEVLALELADGHNVELAGFGTFTVSLQCPPFCNKEEIKTEYVEFKTIKMRVSADLKRKVKQKMVLAKAEDIKRARFRLEQRRKILIEHLEEYGYITSREYRLQTNLCKTTAAKELKQFVMEKLIVSKGNGPGTFYMIAPDKG
ncbi:MAG: hypothetical protein LIP01_03685 [Tannerellaceae bacterium]|nr:hypothetical protein [Tannerellaceae bacterium]